MNLTVMNPTVPQLFNFMIGVLGLTCLTAFRFLIDYAARLLRPVSQRDLRSDSILNRAGNLRVILRTPDWDDFIHLAFAEIRFYGASNIQIARRLHAI